MRAKGGWFCSVLVCLVLTAGCAPRAVRQNWQREQGYEALLRLAAAPLDQVQDLTAEARIAVEQDGRYEQGTAVVQFRRPDLFRLEVRGPLYSHVFTALVQADSLTVWGPAVGGSWRGAVDGPLLAHLTGVDLAGYDLKGALLGTVAPAPIDSAGGVTPAGPDQVVVSLAGEERVRQVWIDVRYGLVTREVIAAPGGQVLLERRLGEYRRVGPLLLPGRVELRQDRAAIVLEYRHYALDRGLPAGRLLQGLPREGLQRLD